MIPNNTDGHRFFLDVAEAILLELRNSCSKQDISLQSSVKLLIVRKNFTCIMKDLTVFYELRDWK
jgi:hypothetical protein